MSATFFDLLKYAATGQASPSMTDFDKMRAMAGGEAVQSITGVPPLSFTGNGAPLISWSMLGNGSQTGTPTPDAPIMPQFVGVRTENLFHYGESWNNISRMGVDYEYVNESKIRIHGKATSGRDVSANISDMPSGQYSARIIVDGTINDDQYHSFNIEVDGVRKFILFGKNKRDATVSFTGQITRAYTIINDTFDGDITISIMLNLGSTALPYEPYGYKIPITCAGQTTPIYIGDPLRKALDGSNAVDVLSSAGTITREVDAEGNALTTPTTQIIDVPEIPTAKGENTLTVDTELQPSSMTITGNIKEV